MLYTSDEIISQLKAIASLLPLERIAEEYKSYVKYTHNGEPDGVPIYRIPGLEYFEEMTEVVLPEGFVPVIEMVYLEKRKAGGLRPHRHLESDAVVRKVGGEGAVVVDGRHEHLLDNTVEIPRGSWHSITAESGVLKFISIQFPNIADRENGNVDLEYLPEPGLDISRLQDFLWAARWEGGRKTEIFDPDTFGELYHASLDKVLAPGEPGSVYGELDKHAYRYVFSFYNPIEKRWSGHPYMTQGREVDPELMEVYGQWKDSHVSTFYYDKLRHCISGCRGIVGINNDSAGRKSISFYVTVIEHQIYALAEAQEVELIEVRLEKAGRRRIIEALKNPDSQLKSVGGLPELVQNLSAVGVQIAFRSHLKELFEDKPEFVLGFVWIALDDAPYAGYHFIPSPSNDPVVSLALYWRGDQGDSDALVFLREVQMFLVKEILAQVEERRAQSRMGTSLSHALKKPVNLVSYILKDSSLSANRKLIVLRKLDEVKNIVTIFDRIRDVKNIEMETYCISDIVHMINDTVGDTFKYGKYSRSEGDYVAGCISRIIENNVLIPVRVMDGVDEQMEIRYNRVLLQILLDENILNMYRHTLVLGIDDNNLAECFRIEVVTPQEGIVEIKFINRDSDQNLKINPIRWEQARSGKIRDENARIAQGMYVNYKLCQAAGWEYDYEVEKQRKESIFKLQIREEGIKDET